jgi:hypothetical protein
MRGIAGTTALLGTLLAAPTAFADGAAGMAFAVDRAAKGETLGAAGPALFLGACAAFLAVVVLLVASHAALDRCAASLDGAARSLPEEGKR